MAKRLGRGLAEIIQVAPKAAGNFVMLRTDQIRQGRFQPRMEIAGPRLEELKASIKRSGVIEPVVVRPIAHGTYELVAGERRLKASQAVGIQEVPAIIKSLSDKEALEFSLVENVQREDLNPLEEARGYARLLDEFGYTQEDIAAAVGKDRATVANTLRLLTLPEDIQQALRSGVIAGGHAKALLAIEDRDAQLALFKQAAAQRLSVRQVEALAGSRVAGRRRRPRRVDPQLRELEDGLRRALGTKVSLTARKKGGRIIIEYFSPEDLTRILERLRISG